MPPKTFTCAICGDPVSKRKSYLYDAKTSQRACKKHQEAQDRAEEFKEADKKKKEDEKTKAKRSRTHSGFPSAWSDPEWEKKAEELRNSCWKCLCLGLPHREFYMRLMVAMEKMKLEGDNVFPNPFDAEETREHYKKVAEHMKHPMKKDERKTVCLSYYPIEEKHIGQVRKRFQMHASLVRHIQLCPICAEKLGLKLEQPKEITFKQLTNWGMLYDITLKKPVEAQAQNELDLKRENFIRRN